MQYQSHLRKVKQEIKSVCIKFDCEGFEEAKEDKENLYSLIDNFIEQSINRQKAL